MKNTGSLSDDEMLEELLDYIKSSNFSNKERNRAERIIERIKASFAFEDEKLDEYYQLRDKVSTILEASNALHEVIYGEESQNQKNDLSDTIKDKILDIIKASNSLSEILYGDKSQNQQDDASDVKSQNIESTTTNFIMSYLDTPSKASLMDISRRQFVLLKMRYGAVDSFLVKVAKSVLDRIDEIEKDIRGSDEQTELMLRGIWFDDANANLSIYLDLLHSNGESVFDATKIASKFRGDYDGQSAVTIVDVKVASMNSEWFSTLLDDYYIDVKKSLFW